MPSLHAIASLIAYWAIWLIAVVRIFDAVPSKRTMVNGVGWALACTFFAAWFSWAALKDDVKRKQQRALSGAQGDEEYEGSPLSPAAALFLAAIPAIGGASAIFAGFVIWPDLQLELVAVGLIGLGYAFFVLFFGRRHRRRWWQIL